MTSRPQVVLGVGGGIAAYKAVLLLREFSEGGADAHVVPTAAALQFVGAATWEALSGRPVTSDPFVNVPDVPHVKIGQHADLVVVAPATADLLAKAAHGLADDLLTNTLLTARCPVIMAPAMHTEMWEHPATIANVATLRERGVIVIEPASGRLTGSDTGPGRLPEPDQLYAIARAVLDSPQKPHPSRDLDGVRVLISTGGTREPLDPVRYMGNVSSGKQGLAIAAAALSRGGIVDVVAGHISAPIPAGVSVTHVNTATQMHAEMLSKAQEADVVIMAAAVADFRPQHKYQTKIKKASGTDGLTLELEQNPDILVDLVAQKSQYQLQQRIVGFAAETGDHNGSVAEYGVAKLRRKQCDALVVNDVSDGAVFGQDENEVSILSADGNSILVPTASKTAVAHAILDAVASPAEKS